MRKNLLIIYFFISCLLISCNKSAESDEQGRVLKKEYFSNGKLKIEGTYIKDTIQDGLIKIYYPTGDIRLETVYKKGFKHGISKGYFLSGKLAAKTEFNNNLQDGWTYKYFPNGNLKSKTFWIDDKPYGDGLYYYSNCQLELYNCIDFFNECLYVLKYDSLGNKIKEDGVVFSPKFATPFKGNAIIAGKECPIKITVANPPKSTASIYIGEVGKGKSIKGLKKYSIKENTVIYTRTYDIPRKYEWVIIGELKDTETGNIYKRDTVFNEVNVINNP